MQCPKCGYLMDPTDLDCPRCVRMATKAVLPPPVPPTPTVNPEVVKAAKVINSRDESRRAASKGCWLFGVAFIQIYVSAFYNLILAIPFAMIFSGTDGMDIFSVLFMISWIVIYFATFRFTDKIVMAILTKIFNIVEKY